MKSIIIILVSFYSHQLFASNNIYKVAMDLFAPGITNTSHLLVVEEGQEGVIFSEDNGITQVIRVVVTKEPNFKDKTVKMEFDISISDQNGDITMQSQPTLSVLEGKKAEVETQGVNGETIMKFVAHTKKVSTL